MAPMPTKLQTEPLVEALCEIQFKSNAPAAQVLPGFLFSNLSGDKEVKKLPIGSLPPEIIAASSHLKFQPTTSMVWNNHQLRFSDHSIQIACNMPYPGWTVFSQAITQVFEQLMKSGIVEEITRYSLKYVDFVPAESVDQRISTISMRLSLGREALNPSNFQVHVEIPSESAVNLLTVASPATEKNPGAGTSRNGTLITTDTIAMDKCLPSQEIIRSEFKQCIDRLHQENKSMFFNSLSEEGIKSLGPMYD